MSGPPHLSLVEDTLDHIADSSRVSSRERGLQLQLFQILEAVSGTIPAVICQTYGEMNQKSSDCLEKTAFTSGEDGFRSMLDDLLLDWDSKPALTSLIKVLYQVATMSTVD